MNVVPRLSQEVQRPWSVLAAVESRSARLLYSLLCSVSPCVSSVRVVICEPACRSKRISLPKLHLPTSPRLLLPRSRRAVYTLTQNLRADRLQPCLPRVSATQPASRRSVYFAHAPQLSCRAALLNSLPLRVKRVLIQSAGTGPAKPRKGSRSRPLEGIQRCWVSESLSR